MIIQAEISLYPLRTQDLAGPIEIFCRKIEERGLKTSVGCMSSIVSGEAGAVFDALKAAMTEVGNGREVVLIVKLSNACPSGSDSGEKRLQLF